MSRQASVLRVVKARLEDVPELPAVPWIFELHAWPRQQLFAYRRQLTYWD